jgi:hypothetical protein
MRGMFLVAVMMLVGGATAAASKQPLPKTASKPDYAKAYTMAARCMVFNTYVSDKTTARVAFDAWKRLGELRRLTNAKMSDDMDWAVSNETVQLSQNPDYRAQTRVDCRALGWAK